MRKAIRELFYGQLCVRSYVILFLLGLILLFARSAYCFTLPSMYTEDGVWLSSIINKGFVSATLQAKGSYLVVGNMLLLKAALMINHLFKGQDITYLAVFVAVVHYVFFSLAALLPLACFKKEIQKPYRLLIWLLILLVPIGKTAYEVMGKISNTGFLFFPIAFCCVFYRLFYPLGRIKLILLDTLLLISCATNPACFFLVALGFLIDFAKYCIGFKELGCKGLKEFLLRYIKDDKNKGWIAIGILCAGMAVYIIAFLAPVGKGLLFDMNIKKSSIIEFLGRALLYSFTYFFYYRLNDALVCIFILAAAAIAVVVLIKCSRESKIKLALCLAAPIIYMVITFMSRPMTPHLDNYTTTWVDRYYYGINITVLIPFAYILSLWDGKGVPALLRYFSRIVAAVLAIIPFVLPEHIFQYDNPLTASTHIIPFKTRVIDALVNQAYLSPEDKHKYVVSIDFEGWFMVLPEEYIWASLLNERDGTLTACNLTDENWTGGIANFGPVLLFPASYQTILDKAITIRANGETLAIDRLEPAGSYLHVVCSGGDLQHFAYPAKIEIVDYR